MDVQARAASHACRRLCQQSGLILIDVRRHLDQPWNLLATAFPVGQILQHCNQPLRLLALAPSFGQLGMGDRSAHAKNVRVSFKVV